MNYTSNFFEIIKPDDWHIHLREGEMLKAVINSSTRINVRCVVMPNLNIPITTSYLAKKYRNEIGNYGDLKSFKPLIPCYLTENLDLKDFKFSLKNDIFIGAKLYPLNATTNSNFGIKKN